jgi:DNA polymerase
LVSSAKELVREWLEEGIDEIDRSLAVATEVGPPLDASAPPSTAEAPGQIAPPRTTEPLIEAPGSPTPEWGDLPNLEQIRESLGDCQRCSLCENRKTIVFGEGNPRADLMFVGEGPGEQEDVQGRPFVGRAGELLTQMIEKGLEIPRSDVYICNIVKCRPPGNRNPLASEASTCKPFLDGQIQAVRPKVIVTLGKPAASLLLEREVAITRLRGTWQQYRGIPLMPTLHPAYILRQYTPENRRLVWEDLKAALTKSRD